MQRINRQKIGNSNNAARGKIKGQGQELTKSDNLSADLPINLMSALKLKSDVFSENSFHADNFIPEDVLMRKKITEKDNLILLRASNRSL